MVVAVTVVGACTAGTRGALGRGAGDAVALSGHQGSAAGGHAVLGRRFRRPSC